MPDLAAFQRSFAASISSGPVPSEPVGMAVYRNTSLKGAVDALGANYPAVRRILGDDSFNRVATGYAALYRPASPVLAAYGARFAEHLTENGWAGALPFLPDVARIERMRTEAHLAADALPFDPASLSGATSAIWLTLTLSIHPATRFALFDNAAVRVWSANSGLEPSLRAFHGDGLLVTRPFEAVSVHPIGPADAFMLTRIQARETIGDAAVATSGRFPGIDLAGLFARLVASGALIAPPFHEGTLR